MTNTETPKLKLKFHGRLSKLVPDRRGDGPDFYMWEGSDGRAYAYIIESYWNGGPTA